MAIASTDAVLSRQTTAEFDAMFGGRDALLNGVGIGETVETVRRDTSFKNTFAGLFKPTELTPDGRDAEAEEVGVVDLEAATESIELETEVPGAQAENAHNSIEMQAIFAEQRDVVIARAQGYRGADPGEAHLYNDLCDEADLGCLSPQAFEQNIQRMNDIVRS